MTVATLGAFQILKPLGVGGMAEVWRARYAPLGLDVALKFLTNLSVFGEDALASVRNEVRTLAGLCHPNLITIHELGELSSPLELAPQHILPPGTAYLVLELMNGGTLEDQRVRLRWPALKRILMVLLDALGHAHARGVLHLDLKPDNVLFEGSGDPSKLKLTDFGIARVQGRKELTDAFGNRRKLARDLERLNDLVLGTPLYMAPEQLLGDWRDQGPWTDLYALGCLTYHLISGAPPFQGDSVTALMQAHCEQLPAAPHRDFPIPEGLVSWVLKLLEKEPHKRFLRAADAAWALEKLGPPMLEPSKIRNTGRTPAQPTRDATTDPFRHNPFQQSTRRLTADEASSLAVASRLLSESDAQAQISRRPEPAPAPAIPVSWAAAVDLVPPRAPQGLGLSLFGLRSIPLVDRSAERDALWQTLHQVATTQRPHAVVLRGPTGVGKSRLAEWMSERAHEVGAAQVLVASHAPGYSTSEGLAGMLFRYLVLQGLQDDAAVSRLQETLARLGLADAHLLRPLLELVRPALASGKGHHAVQEYPLNERHAALRGLLAALTIERPLVLWLDDVHYGLETLRFAKSLLQGVSSQPLPVLLLLTAPDEGLHERLLEASELEELQQLPQAQTLRLEPLAEPDQAQLIRDQLGLEPQSAARVEARTGGNPLFVLQLVGDWVERGILEPTARGFSLRANAQVPVPDDIHSVWLQRLAQVGALDGQPSLVALELAAVLGRTVDRTEWYQLCAQSKLPLSTAQLLKLEEQLLDLHFVEREGGQRSTSASIPVGGRSHRWRFTHGLMRESLERSAREHGRLEQLHAACADALDALYGQTPGALSERRAHHRMAAGQLEAALEPLLQAVSYQGKRGTLERALELARRHRELMDQLRLPEDDVRRCALDAKECHLLMTVQKIKEVEVRLARLRAGLERPTWQPWRDTILRLHGDYCRYRGEFNLARSWYEKALGVARDQKDLLELGSVYRGLANVVWARGEAQEAERLYEQALRCFRQVEHPVGISAGYVFLGFMAEHGGDLSRARGFMAEGLRIAEEHGLQAAQADALRALGRLRMATGDDAGARALLQRARTLFESLGTHYSLPDCINELGEVERKAGQLEQAERLFLEALTLGQRASSGMLHAPRINLATVYLLQGRGAEAQRLLDGQLEKLRQSGHLRWEGAVMLALLWAALLQRRAPEARELVQALRTYAEVTPAMLDREDAEVLEQLLPLVAGWQQPPLWAEVQALAARVWERLERPQDALRVQQLRRMS